MQRHPLRSAAVLLILPLAAPALACNVPVYRYALERWPAEPYEVLVFHRGPLTKAREAALAPLHEALDRGGPQPAALVQTVDLAGEVAPERAAVWEARSPAPLPRVVARYPAVAGVEEDAWAGPLEVEAVARLADSPARQAVAKHLMAGASAVFVLLESGDAAKDAAARAVLARESARLAETLRLPAPPPGEWNDPVYDTQGPPDLQIAFATVAVRRDDPAEAALVSMLLHTEADLGEFAEPMVFPVYGRGLVLWALVGEGINAANLEEAAGFLVGPCSCIVKQQNPGIELLIPVDWASGIEGDFVASPLVEPPLAGVVGVGPPETEAAERSPAPPAPAPPAPAPSLLGPAVAAVAGGVALLAIAGLVLLRRRAAR